MQKRRGSHWFDVETQKRRDEQLEFDYLRRKQNLWQNDDGFDEAGNPIRITASQNSSASTPPSTARATRGQHDHYNWWTTANVATPNIQKEEPSRKEEDILANLANSQSQSAVFHN